MRNDPKKWLHRFVHLLDDLEGLRILNPLGSNGRKAVPLALLGGDVTVVDISAENRRYALDVACEAGVNIEYFVSDFLSWDDLCHRSRFDLVLLEGGVLHYFTDLDALFAKTRMLMRRGGRLILQDAHPVRVSVERNLDYFDSDLHENPVAYEGFFAESERDSFPKCILRWWTLGEIVTAIGGNGMAIRSLQEEAYEQDKRIPANYLLVAEAIELA